MPATEVLPVRKRAIPKQRVALALAGVLLMLLAGVVYRIQTDKGTLVVEINDDAVEVRLKKSGLVLHDAASGRTYDIRVVGTQNVPSGNYRPKEVRSSTKEPEAGLKLIVLDDAGAETTSNEFKLSRGGRLRVLVTLEDTVVASTKPAASDRRPLDQSIQLNKSPLDALDPAAIPAAERFPWQPKELVAVLGEDRQRLWGFLNTMSLTADGKIIATDNMLWDVEKQRIVRHLNVPGPWHQSVISQDGRLLHAGDTIFDLTGKEPRAVAEFPDSASYVQAMTSDGKLLITGAYPGTPALVTVWDLGKLNPKPLAKFEGANVLALSPDNKSLTLTFVKEAKLKLIDLTAPPYRMTAETAFDYGDNAYCVLYLSPSRLVTLDKDLQLKLWDISANGFRELAKTQVKHGGSLFSAQGGHRFLLVNQQVQCWEVEKEQLAASWTLDFRPGTPLGWSNGNLIQAALTPNGQTLVTGHLSGAVRFFDVTDPALPERMPLRHQPLSSQFPRFFLNGDSLVVQDESHTVKHWRFGGAQPQTAPLPTEILTGGYVPAGWTPDGRISLFGSIYGHETKIMERAGDQFVVRKTLPETDVQEAGFSADGKLVARSFLDGIKIFDLSGTAPVLRIDQKYPGVRPIHLSADGKTLAVLSQEKSTMEIWDVGANELTNRRTIKGRGFQGLPALLTPDGKTLLFGAYPGSELWDVSQNPPKRLPVSLPDDLGGLTSARFLANPKHVVLAGSTGRFGIWDLDAGAWKWQGKLPGQIMRITATPDGRHIITGNGNGTVYVFRTGLAPSPVSTDPDRRAAEYVLSVGGTVDITENGQVRRTGTVGDLPQGAFELESVNLRGNQKVSDAGLAHFKDCKNLTKFDLRNTAVSDAGLAHFKDCENLKDIILNGAGVSDAGLANFKDHKNLTSLGLVGTQVSDAGLTHFRDCKNLMLLHLTSTRVSDAALAVFQDCKNLTDLNLGNTQVSDSGLAHFMDCKNLTDLRLINTQVSDAVLANLVGCPKLVYLNVTKTKVTEAGVKKLSAALPGCKIDWDGGVIEPTITADRRAAEWVLSIGGRVNIKENDSERQIGAVGDLPREAFELTAVDLRNNPEVSDAGLALFKDCKNLTFLFLGQTKVSDVGLAHFKECKNLRALDLDNTQVSDAGLFYFRDCENLTMLNLMGTKVSDAGLALFQNRKNFTSLQLSGTQVTDVGLAHFQDCKDLTLLTLSQTQVSDVGLAHFRDCKNILQLILSQTQVSDVGLAHFRDCKNLTQLELIQTQVSDVGLAHFQDCKNLTHLVLGVTKVSDVGLSHFQDCKNLLYLNLGQTQVSDVGLAHFKDCKNLIQVNLSFTKVSDMGLAHFAGCPNLDSVKLLKTKVTEAGVKKLSASLPKCQIDWDGGVIVPSSSNKPK